MRRNEIFEEPALRMIFSSARSPLAVPSIVYEHPDPAAFFDGMSFDPTGKLGWLMDDPIKGKVQFLITDDSGAPWKALPEERLPSLADGVAAFAANGTHLLNPNRETAIVAAAQNLTPDGLSVCCCVCGQGRRPVSVDHHGTIWNRSIHRWRRIMVPGEPHRLSHAVRRFSVHALGRWLRRPSGPLAT